MASSRWFAAAALALAAGVGAAPAVDLCEGCWEVTARGAYLIPSDDAGPDPAAGLGVGGAFRFRPFWSVEAGMERYPGSIPDGPDETVTFLTASLLYTFRAARDQRTRPLVFLVLGYAWDQVGSSQQEVSTPGGTLTASSRAASDGGFAWGLGAGGATSLGSRTSLRYDVRLLDYASFGVGQEAIVLSVGVAVRLGD